MNYMEKKRQIGELRIIIGPHVIVSNYVCIMLLFVHHSRDETFLEKTNLSTRNLVAISSDEFSPGFMFPCWGINAEGIQEGL